MPTGLRGFLLLGLLVLSCSYGSANDPKAPVDLTGVYDLLPLDAKLPKGFERPYGSPEQISLLPAAKDEEAKINLNDDPLNQCQPIGPFRMMAMDGNRIELLPAPEWTVMLFQDIYRGHERIIHPTLEHSAKAPATWDGDSIAHWEGDTFVIDTTKFNEKTWLNSQGAQHGPALHLVEKITSLDQGEYLKYQMTAEDPSTLTAPYTYLRYYRRSHKEIQEYVCQEKD